MIQNNPGERCVSPSPLGAGVMCHTSPAFPVLGVIHVEGEMDELRDLVEPSEMTQVCQGCGVQAEPRLSRSGKHIKAECSACGRYIKFVRQLNPEPWGYGNAEPDRQEASDEVRMLCPWGAFRGQHDAAVA